VISISDAGTGIKKKDLDHVFEPFFTTKGVAEGTGMGLSMVYGFVKQSGGHVTIQSKRGKGTTINLYFPATEGLDEEKKEKSATRPMVEAKGTETILVVEDDEGVRQVTLEMLNELGYVVLEAEDGPSALKVLGKDSDSVNLVLSDVIMPSGMSGVDLANEMKRHYQDIKVLMTSGYPENVIDKDGIDSSGITLLRKPFTMADLAEAVRGAMDR
jgi:two-component system CheB/CheR fusion protein